MLAMLPMKSMTTIVMRMCEDDDDQDVYHHEWMITHNSDAANW
jgi:hypothetical protein